MKYSTSLLTLLLTLCMVSLAFTQVTPVLTGLNGPWGITVHDNVMYVGENTNDRVVKADLNQANLSSEVYVTGVSGASSLLVVDGTLYIGERNGNRISQHPIDEVGGVAETCTSLEFPPVGLGHRNGSIYIAEREGNKVSRTNIQSGCGSGFNTIIGDISQAYGLAIDGDILYCSDADGGFVFSINLTDKQYVKDTIVDGLMTPAGLHVVDNTLYIAEFANDRLHKVTNIGENQTIEIFVTGDGPLAVSSDSNGEIYITEFNANRVSKLGTQVINNTDDLNTQLDVNLYPNPAQEIIRLESTERYDTYLIRDALGTVVQKGSLTHEQSIAIENLQSGAYYLTLDLGRTIEFAKQ